MDEILKRDQNHVTVLAGVTDDSDQDIKMLRVDPISKRLLVRANISGSGVVTSVSNLDGSLIIAPTTGDVIASLNTAHANIFTVPQTFTGEIINTYTVSTPTGVVTCTINYDVNANWEAGNYDQFIRVYSYKDTPSGRVYSATYLQSANFPPTGMGAMNAEFDWGGWTVPGDADGIILVRYSGDPVQPMNYDYYTDLGSGTSYSDYGDEWNNFNFPNFLSIINEYDSSQYNYGAINFNPNQQADGLFASDILTIGADDGYRSTLRFENAEWHFVTSDPATDATVRASVIGQNGFFTFINSPQITGTFIGTVNVPSGDLPAGRIAVWDSSNNLSNFSLIRYVNDVSNGPALTIGPFVTTNGSFKIWMNTGSSNSQQILFTNSATGNTLSDGYAIGIDSTGGAIFNNRENTPQRWATNAIFTMQLNATGELVVGNSAFFGNTLSQFAVQNVPAATTKITAIFKPIASQTGDLTQWTDSSSVAVTKVNAAGNIGVRMGATALTSYLHIAAGTTAASTAPLKLTTGANMTTAEAGAIEYTNPDLFFTPGSAVRYNLPLVTGAGVQGDIIYASGASIYSRLAKDANATRYLSNTGTSNNPAWAQINLANGVTGTLPVANGGTGQTTPVVKSASFSGVGTATTTFTVTIGTTQANATYKINVTPTNILSAAVFYVNNKTTTTFDVVYLTGLTGTVTFDWSLFT